MTGRLMTAALTLAYAGLAGAQTRTTDVEAAWGLIANGQDSYEVAKMAVDESRRNLGIGKTMLGHVVDAARALGARKLTLETNSNLMNAIHVYESLGFEHIDPSLVEPSPYKRANVFMERVL